MFSLAYLYSYAYAYVLVKINLKLLGNLELLSQPVRGVTKTNRFSYAFPALGAVDTYVLRVLGPVNQRIG